MSVSVCVGGGGGGREVLVEGISHMQVAIIL